jgi:nitrate reductase alpha subunit
MARSEATRRLLRTLQYFRRGERCGGGWQELSPRDREWEDAYRNRWQHDREVRTTHGVNCTGSCSWRVHVKGGVITWETQETDYPSNGPDAPEYEPRGCPRGASFSWYTYSPLRVKHPYVRGALLERWRALRRRHADPVDAWAALAGDPEATRAYRRARGHGGFVRAGWDEALELVAAATVYNVREHGPDRVAGFSPIPAMSMASYAAGSRFLTLLGGTVVSFYDWYCDLPVASPQVWGEQTDVPESADWYNSRYLLVWGSNVPMTRTPDAHFLAEARYRGARVVGVSPDYAEHVKFADEWLAPAPGTDGALAMAMTHVILREFYADRQEPAFQDYAKRFTDLPCLVLLRPVAGGGHALDRFLRAGDLGLETPRADWKLVVRDASGRLAVPGSSLGFRWDGSGRWNLDLRDGRTGEPFDPALTLLDARDGLAEVAFPVFGEAGARLVRRSLPVVRVRTADGERLATTVLDALLAHAGVSRGLPGEYPAGYDDPQPCTPAWQEAITGVPRARAAAVARGFAANAAATGGRSTVIMGAGINHWYHGDQIYRAILNLVLLCGCQGRNGGGWAHYVGQEKVRPLEGWSLVAFARDWGVPPRLQNGTSFYYFATDQWRYDPGSTADLLSPLAGEAGAPPPAHAADCNVLAVRLGWLPSYPQFDRNPLRLADEVGGGGAGAGDEGTWRREVVRRLTDGSLRFAIEDPDDPANFPRQLFVWRGNPITSSGKGQEYFLRHLLGTGHGVLGEAAAPERRPREVVWREPAPEGKLDLLVTLDFRMSGTALYSDVVLPAATWYEKHDLSSTDLHPFVHPLNPAIAPPWEARSDWDIFVGLARRVSELGGRHLGVRRDLVALPLAHDSPDELAQPLGRVADWKRGETEPVPGRTMPALRLVERDYGRIHERMTALGPAVATAGLAVKGIAWPAREEYEVLRAVLGEHRAGGAAGCPRLETAQQACEAILTLSGATHGAVAVRGWQALERVTGLPLADLAEGRRDERFTLADLAAQPRKTITAPAWSGIERADRRYNAFAVNVDRGVPWRTLSGRQHLYLDHEWIRALGESLPVYRPPLHVRPFLGEGERSGLGERPGVELRYITPHGKWSIHSTYGDNERMLTLFRGGPTLWLNKDDAAAIGVEDNDWVEVLNRNGLAMARAVTSHRLPRGMCLSYHVQDRTVQVPVSPVTGERAGGHNSVTRITMKPTHMIGGYAQTSYGFNYYGPTGSQRDEVVRVRKAAKGDVWG